METTPVCTLSPAHPGAAAPAPAGMRLEDLATGTPAQVVSVSAMHTDGPHTGASVELGRRLAELGFLPGEKLKIVARGFMGREPIAVRIGTGTFALRLFEAACIRVSPEQPLLR
ncbi:MAG: ferrous iron transport protein [Gammaproteobacteria bacterium]|nr:ferrous iron transport protein [Gammaproteobacteria bacterium]